MKNSSQHKKGFTLVEVIVSLALLMSAITGPMILARRSLSVSRDARVELEATHLAEEGIEIVHSIRDNNSAADDTKGVSGTNWLTGISSACGAGTFGCVADTTSHPNTSVWKLTGSGAALTACATADCAVGKPLYKNIASGLYRQTGNGSPVPATQWKQTSFTRVITVTDVVAGRQIRVAATVTYKSFNGQTRTITVTENLYNWFPCLDPVLCPL